MPSGHPAELPIVERTECPAWSVGNPWFSPWPRGLAIRPHQILGTPRSERSWQRNRFGRSPRRGPASHRHLEYGQRQIPDHSTPECRGYGGRCAGREKHFAPASVTFGTTETPVGSLAITTAPGAIAWTQRDRLPRPTTETAEMRSGSTATVTITPPQLVVGPAASVRALLASTQTGANAEIVSMAATVRRIRTTGRAEGSLPGDR
jgi:hypothetical protein